MNKNVRGVQFGIILYKNMGVTVCNRDFIKSAITNRRIRPGVGLSKVRHFFFDLGKSKSRKEKTLISQLTDQGSVFHLKK